MLGVPGARCTENLPCESLRLSTVRQLGAEGPAEEDGATGWGPERRVRSAVTQNCHRKKGILSSVKSLGCGSYLSQQLEHPDTQPSRNL